MIILNEVIKIIKQEALLENVKATGVVLMGGLLDFQKNYPELVNSVRGLGTFIAFDLPSASQRDTVISKLKKKGIDFFRNF